jgi:hypothetical protein
MCDRRIIRAAEGIRLRHRRTLFTGAIALVILAISSATAAAAKRPDLVVKKSAPPPASLSVGDSFRAKDTTANKGKRRARKSKTGYLLSRDTKKGRGDIALGKRRVKALKPGRKDAGKKKLTVPDATKARAYYLLSCADLKKALREAKEKNNCRASKSKVRIEKDGTIPRPGYFPRPASPLKVSPSLQGGRAVAKTIGTAGGTLTAMAANGTKFTLTVPENALVSAEEITMTPVGSIAGFPFSGLIGAVQITPHGLQLLAPATLVIEPPAGTSLADRTGFLAHEDGEDFQLQPLAVGSGLRMSLMHFSTPGVGRATSAEIAGALSRMPVRTKAQYDSLMADVLKRHENDLGAASDELAALSAAYYRDVIQPLYDKAINDDSYAEAAISELLEWARGLELLGLDGHPYVKALHASVMEKVVAILRNAVNQSYERCRDHDLSEVTRLIGFERAAQLLEVDLGDAFGKAERCARFELDFDTRMNDGQAGAFASTIHVQVQDLALSMSPERAYQITGQDTLDYLSFDVVPKVQCVRASAGQAQPFTPFLVLDLGFEYNITERKQPDGKVIREIPPPKVRMSMHAGFANEPFEYWVPSGACNGNDSVRHASDALTFVRTWTRNHEAEEATFPGVGYLLEDWGTPSGALVGRKTYQFSGLNEFGQASKETTTLDLFHRPQ